MIKKSGLMLVVFFLVLLVCKAVLAVDFFNDDVEKPGRYVYAYPDSSKIEEVFSESYSGQSALEITLDANAYSGVAVGNYPISDLASLKDNGYLEFWVKGTEGDEMFQVALIDCDNIDGNKVELRLPISKYAKVLPTWQKVRIPLSEFGNEGVYWDGSREVKDNFNWHDVVEVKFLIPPIPGKDSITFYVDVVKVVK
jgi:hypothetical protein